MSNLILKFDFLETIAKQVREDLERDALRTIRQRNAEKGAAILNQIEGIEHLMDAIHRAAGHGFYKHAGLVSDEQIPVIRSHSRVEVISKKKRA